MGDASIIATIPAGASREVRVALGVERGAPVIDLRTFADFKAGPATVRGPTKEGVSIAIERLPELIRALQAARAQAEAQGLLNAP